MEGEEGQRRGRKWRKGKEKGKKRRGGRGEGRGGGEERIRIEGFNRQFTTIHSTTVTISYHTL